MRSSHTELFWRYDWRCIGTASLSRGSLRWPLYFSLMPGPSFRLKFLPVQENLPEPGVIAADIVNYLQCTLVANLQFKSNV